jgi:hypothetical protein
LESILVVEVEKTVAEHGPFSQVENDNHEDVLVVGVDENVLEAPCGIDPCIADTLSRTSVAGKVIRGDGVKIRPKRKGWCRVQGDSPHRRRKGGPKLWFREKLHFAGCALEAPNDPKLSDRGNWRDCCMAAAMRRLAAADVTAGAVRCSAWLGVRGSRLDGDANMCGCSEAGIVVKVAICRHNKFGVLHIPNTPGPISACPSGYIANELADTHVGMSATQRDEQSDDLRFGGCCVC